MSKILMPAEKQIGDFLVRTDDGEYYDIYRPSPGLNEWIGSGSISKGCTAHLGEDQDALFEEIECWVKKIGETRTSYRRYKRRVAVVKDVDAECSYSDFVGKCQPRLQDGKCIWCERPLYTELSKNEHVKPRSKKQIIITIHNEFHRTEARMKVSFDDYKTLRSEGWKQRDIESYFWIALEDLASRPYEDAAKAKLRRLKKKLCGVTDCGCGGCYHSRL